MAEFTRKGWRRRTIRSGRSRHGFLERLMPNLDREAQAARTGVLRVGIRDLELAAEQVFLPFEFRPLEVRQALRVDEHAHVLLGHDDVRRPRSLREIHPVLHPAAPARDDPKAKRGGRLVLLLPQHADPSDRAFSDGERQLLGGHQTNRVPIRSNAGPRLKSCAAIRAVDVECTSFAAATTKDIYNNVIVSNPLLENGRPDPWFPRAYSKSKWRSRSTSTASFPISMRTRRRRASTRTSSGSFRARRMSPSGSSSGASGRTGTGSR